MEAEKAHAVRDDFKRVYEKLDELQGRIEQLEKNFDDFLHDIKGAH